MKDSDRLRREIDILKSISSFNYILRVHNEIGKKLMRDNSYSETRLNVSDYKNDYRGAGAWEGINCSTGETSIIYDIDFLRSMYQTERYRDIALAAWSLVGHEWGHVAQDMEGKLFRNVSDGEKDADRIMEGIMKDFGFSDKEISDSQRLYYSVFEDLKKREWVKAILEGKGREQW